MSKDPELIAIDPDGDIILELSRPDGKTNLQVSSKILTLTSPVFTSMFRSRFKENISDNKATSASPLCIPLPEEDEEALVILCEVLHFHIDKVPQALSLACLSNIAAICDKWDFTKAIALAATLWLQDIDWSKANDLNEYLLVAYLLDIPPAFSRISWEIIIRQAGQFVDLPGLNSNVRIPDNLLLAFNLRKSNIELDLLIAVEGIISKFWMCLKFGSNAGRFFSMLEESTLWPAGEQLRHRSLSAILNNLNISDDWGSFMTCSDSTRCLCTLAKFTQALRDVRDLILNKKRGLCLDCVKTRGKSHQEKTCRLCITQ